MLAGKGEPRCRYCFVANRLSLCYPDFTRFISGVSEILLLLLLYYPYYC